MEIITVKIGERAQIAAMSANDAAAEVRRISDNFVAVLTDRIDAIRTEHAGVGVARPDSSLPSAVQSPSCKGCGMHVEPGERYCTACKEKPQYQSPRATIETGPQPAPPYTDAPIGQVLR